MMESSMMLEKMATGAAKVDTLFDSFDAFCDVEEGVAKLRELILDLAVRGKLVEQADDDEPGDVLLKRLAAGKTSKSKTSENPFDDIPPFEIPNSWEWVRFEQIIDFDFGKTPSTKVSQYWGVGEIPWVSIADMPASGTISATKKTVTEHAVSEVFKRPPVPKGTLLMSFKLSIGKVAFLSFDAYHNEAIISINPSIPEVSQYLHVCLRGIDLLAGSSAAIKGKTLNKTSLREIAIPLPPLAEQKRIVAKVDELMQLTGELETQINRRTEIRTAASRSSLAHVTGSTTRSEFQRAWQRVNDHFDSLYSVPENLSDLRQTILQLAVQGKLVPQDPEDEPAEELLNRIGERRESLRKAKSIRRVESEPIEQVPFELKLGWEWVRLGDLVESMTNGLYKPSRYYSESGIACLRMYNIREGSLDLTKLKRLELTDDEKQKYSLVQGDLIVNRVNSRELVGKAAVVQQLPEHFVYEAMNIRVRLLETDSMPDYINLLFRTSAIRERFQNAAKQASGQASVSQPQVSGVLVPLAPLAEQKRIVTKVDSLLAQLAELATQLESRERTTGELLEAAIHGVLEGA